MRKCLCAFPVMDEIVYFPLVQFSFLILLLSHQSLLGDKQNKQFSNLFLFPPFLLIADAITRQKDCLVYAARKRKYSHSILADRHTSISDVIEVERGKHFSHMSGHLKKLALENCIAMWNELTFDCEPKPHRIW